MLNNIISLESNWAGIMSEHQRTCALKHPSKYLRDDVVHQFQEVVSKIDYKDNWSVKIIGHDGWMIMQIQTVMIDSSTGEPFHNNSRPLVLCENMKQGLLIDLAFELIKEMELHEAAEFFNYDGNKIYFPHDDRTLPLRVVQGLRE